jgi:hypothetical protein
MSEFEDRLAEVFRETFGLSESAARVAARGRNPAPRDDPFDELLESFHRQGLSEAAARHAAIGRAGSEHAARQFMGSRPSAGGTSREEGSPRPTGPAAMVAAHEAALEARTWRLIAEEAERVGDRELRDRAIERRDAKLLEAVQLLPPDLPTPAKSNRKPAKRIVEVDGRRMVEEVSLVTGETVLSEPRPRRR